MVFQGVRAFLTGGFVTAALRYFDKQGRSVALHPNIRKSDLAENA